ncbi:MAG TPA: dioxygenase [Xanthobacteraceae bacterium]|jgi:hydroxyquinol 1,2-dioxygenase
MPYVTEETLTDIALKRWSDIADPRLRQVMRALVKHVHAFVREVEPTQAEWVTAIDFLTRTGQMCNDKRQEFILFSDVLGASMLVDAVNHRRSSGATPSTVEGPFHVSDAPAMDDGDNMAANAPGIACFCTGKVSGLSGEPIAGAALDLWQTDGEGLYEAQRPGIDGPWMRGLYRTQADGSYLIRTVAPIAYTIPMDGTVGELMNRTNMSHMRPAHIHFALEAPGYHSLVTHLFQAGNEWINDDAVYGVKEPLIVEFKKMPAGSKAPSGEIMNEPFYVVNYDFVLERKAQAAAA